MARISDVYPSKYFTAADLQGQAHAYTIAQADIGWVGEGDQARQQVMLTFEESDKQLGLNKTNAKAITGLYGDDTDDWIGEQVVLFPTRVDYQGKMVDAVRVDESQSRRILQDKLKAQKAQQQRGGAPAAKPAGKPITQKEVVAEGFDKIDGDSDIPF